jgi:type I restriction enzyme M protein
VRSFIPSTASWPKVRKLTGNVGQKLTDIMRDVAKANPSLQGVIDTVDFNATVSGQRIVEDGRLSVLIEILSRHRLGLDDVEPDIFGTNTSCANSLRVKARQPVSSTRRRKSAG